MRGFVLALDDGERVHHVVDLVAGEAVQMKIERVQFSAKLCAARFVPGEGRSVVTHVPREGLHVVRRVDQFQHPRFDEVDQLRRVAVGRENGELLDVGVGQMSSTNFLSS